MLCGREVNVSTSCGPAAGDILTPAPFTLYTTYVNILPTPEPHANSIYRSVLYLVDKFSVGNEEKAILFTPGALNEPKFLGVSEYLGQGPIAGPFGIATYDGLVSILPEPASDKLNVHESRSVTFFDHNFEHRYDARFLPPSCQGRRRMVAAD
jgi:hypothetical protein